MDMWINLWITQAFRPGTQPHGTKAPQVPDVTHRWMFRRPIAAAAAPAWRLGWVYHTSSSCCRQIPGPRGGYTTPQLPASRLLDPAGGELLRYTTDDPAQDHRQGPQPPSQARSSLLHLDRRQPHGPQAQPRPCPWPGSYAHHGPPPRHQEGPRLSLLPQGRYHHGRPHDERPPSQEVLGLSSPSLHKPAHSSYAWRVACARDAGASSGGGAGRYGQGPAGMEQGIRGPRSIRGQDRATFQIEGHHSRSS